MPGSFIQTVCFNCQKEQNFHRSFYTKNNDLDGIVPIICPYCKQVIISINQAMLFEIYFQCAIEHIIQKNYAEAVFFLAKTRESFFKYIIYLILYEQDSSIDLDSFFKQISLSERRFGAFCALYQLRFKKNFKMKKDAELRNKIIHAEYYPLEKDVLEYGQNTLDIINEVLKEVLENIDQLHITKLNHLFQKEKVEAYLKTYKDANPQIVYCCDSVISWNCFSEEERIQNERKASFSKNNPTEWRDLAIQANAQNKIIYIDDTGKAVLKEQHEYKTNTKRTYQPTENFKILIKHVKRMNEGLRAHSIPYPS